MHFPMGWWCHSPPLSHHQPTVGILWASIRQRTARTIQGQRTRRPAFRPSSTVSIITVSIRLGFVRVVIRLDVATHFRSECSGASRPVKRQCGASQRKRATTILQQQPDFRSQKGLVLMDVRSPDMDGPRVDILQISQWRQQYRSGGIRRTCYSSSQPMRRLFLWNKLRLRPIPRR